MINFENIETNHSKIEMKLYKSYVIQFNYDHGKAYSKIIADLAEDFEFIENVKSNIVQLPIKFKK